MRRLRLPLITAMALLIVSPLVHAAPILTATLTTDQEPCPVVPTTSTGDPRAVGFGAGTFMLNDTKTALSMSVEIFNIDVTGAQTPDTNDNLVAAHIHCCALPGASAGVVWGFFGAPFNDNNPNDAVVIPFANGVGGTFLGKWDLAEGNNTTLAAQLPNILEGLSYINFHTVQFRGGEIRGQILAPEPGALVLLGLAAAGLMGRRRRQV